LDKLIVFAGFENNVDCGDILRLGMVAEVEADQGLRGGSH
jgi:hypothetical protein